MLVWVQCTADCKINLHEEFFSSEWAFFSKSAMCISLEGRLTKPLDSGRILHDVFSALYKEHNWGRPLSDKEWNDYSGIV